MTEREVVIVDGCRTAFGKKGGGLKDFAASELGGICVKALLERSGIVERGGKVDSLLAGMAINDTRSNATARYIAQLAGLPYDVSATFVEMQCGSAITSLNHAAWKIKMGVSDIAIVGGVESHSNLPTLFATDMTPYRDRVMPITRHLSPFAEQDTNMIQNSDKMAEHWGIERSACDEFAVRSQERLQAAYESGLIGGEIVPVTIPATRKTPEIIINKDEHPRPGVTLEKISGMAPIFPGGVTTAANASGTNDGAAFLLVMTAEKAKELGYTPFARWVGGAHAGIRADHMGVAASYSNLKAAKQVGLKLKDFDVFESNEAFAAQQLAVIKDMQEATGETIDQSKWNPNGGAIAIGHPNAASGARITWFAMKQLEKTGGRYASISSCCGGGQGSTAIIENLRR